MHVGEATRRKDRCADAGAGTGLTDDRRAPRGIEPVERDQVQVVQRNLDRALDGGRQLVVVTDVDDLHVVALGEELVDREGR